jgi:hypothetical protein
MPGFASENRRLTGSLSAATPVLSLFAAYAFLAPATYEARAVVQVEVPMGLEENPLPPPEEAARRLRADVLGAERLNKAIEQERSRSAAEPSDKNQLMDAASMTTADAEHFDVVVSAGDAGHAQRLANLLARLAVDRAPKVFDVPQAAAPSPEQKKRQDSIRDLASFLSAHPEIVFDAPELEESAPNDAGKKKQPDDLLINLYSEKRRLEKDLAAGLAAQASDNPYVESNKIDADVTTLKRRLTEVDAAIGARKDALAGKKEQAKKPQALPADLEKEWKERLRAVAELGRGGVAPDPESRQVASPQGSCARRPCRLLQSRRTGRACSGWARLPPRWQLPRRGSSSNPAVDRAGRNEPATRTLRRDE